MQSFCGSLSSGCTELEEPPGHLGRWLRQQAEKLSCRKLLFVREAWPSKPPRACVVHEGDAEQTHWVYFFHNTCKRISGFYFKSNVQNTFIKILDFYSKFQCNVYNTDLDTICHRT